jgi:hypothetical protein
MTPRSLFYRVIFSTTYTEKNDPKAMNSNDSKAKNFTVKGVTFLCRILTGGQISTKKNDPPDIILRGHFSTTYTEKNDPRAMNSTEKGVTSLRYTGNYIKPPFVDTIPPRYECD